jgi:hypothetical protein
MRLWGFSGFLTPGSPPGFASNSIGGVMNKSIVASLFAAALVMGGSAYASWHFSDTERAKRDVRETLVDPASAIFSDIESCADYGKLVYVTGLVNARNSMGGMNGKKRFLAQAVGGGFISTVETGDMFDNPNLGDKFAKARRYAAAHPMSCKRVEQIAAAEFTSMGRIDPDEDDMSPVSGGDDATIANIAAVSADINSSVDDMTPVDGS